MNSDPRTPRIVIVGGGAAGLAVLETARAGGFSGEVIIVGDEPHLPYDRPPLSKQVLSGAWEVDRVVLRDSSYLERLGVTLHSGVPATALDSDAREVVLADGHRIHYDDVVVATGVTPRWLPGTEHLRGVYVLRGIDDALALREEMVPDARLVIVGAGVLGCEVAAVARGMEIETTLVDPLPMPMSRIVGGEVSRMIAEMHREHGVTSCLGAGVRRLHEVDGRVDVVELDDGRLLPADVVLVAIGSTPSVEWLRTSTVELGGPTAEQGSGGVLCTQRGRAGDRIYAAGDVAAWWDPDGHVYRRVEHRLSAGEQGAVVARSILGDSTAPPPAIPYFWSDQYGAKIQYYGSPTPEDDFAVVEGDLESRKFIGVHLRGGVVGAVVGVGLPRQLRGWRAKVGQPLNLAHT